jgi:hypothetical protein
MNSFLNRCIVKVSRETKAFPKDGIGYFKNGASGFSPSNQILSTFIEIIKLLGIIREQHGIPPSQALRPGKT